MGYLLRVEGPLRGVGQVLPREVAVRMAIDHHPGAVDLQGFVQQQRVDQLRERLMGDQESGVAIG
ncbi:hypothetical protein D3C85_1536530 [compost metagenome]